MIKKALSLALPHLIGTAGRQRLSILIYHRVLPETDFMRPDETTICDFDWQMELLSRYFNPLPLSDALNLMDECKLPERAVCITFDDGYADNEQCALPILRKWNIPATVYVATGFLDGGCMWNDTVIESIRGMVGEFVNLDEMALPCLNLSSPIQRKISAGQILKTIKHWSPARRTEAVEYIACKNSSKVQNIMLTKEQLLNLHNSGVEIGAHTVTHPILAKISEEQAMSEIYDSKQFLEKTLKAPIRYFAYPNGQPEKDYSSRHKALVKQAGYEAAVSTRWGVNTQLSDRWQLARFTPWDRRSNSFMCRLLANYRNPVL